MPHHLHEGRITASLLRAIEGFLHERRQLRAR
jgi:hypothetical protein